MVVGNVVQQNKGTANRNSLPVKVHDCLGEYILYCTNKGFHLYLLSNWPQADPQLQTVTVR